ncbi:hypothetical protein [Pseudomonas fluorescens]|jgi:hypothetical protein|uniref:hypothetical protein n=1 Tax=Pseudomonas fluorescens TaxID=294 RepID=UPI00160F61D1|nr:hypothetical protein [Pseudomonas fluorescens]
MRLEALSRLDHSMSGRGFIGFYHVIVTRHTITRFARTSVAGVAGLIVLTGS